MNHDTLKYKMGNSILGLSLSMVKSIRMKRVKKGIYFLFQSDMIRVDGNDICCPSKEANQPILPV